MRAICAADASSRRSQQGASGLRCHQFTSSVSRRPVTGQGCEATPGPMHVHACARRTCASVREQSVHARHMRVYTMTASAHLCCMLHPCCMLHLCYTSSAGHLVTKLCLCSAARNGTARMDLNGMVWRVVACLGVAQDGCAYHTFPSNQASSQTSMMCGIGKQVDGKC